MLFDSHAHIISGDADRYPPGPIDGKVTPQLLENPVTAETLLQWMDQNGVRRAALVQRAHVYGYDNSYIVDAAAKYPDRFCAVACVDARKPDAPSTVKDLLKQGVVAIRLTSPNGGGPVKPAVDPGLDWLVGANAQNVWKTIADSNASLVVHLYNWNRLAALQAVRPLLERYSGMPVVFDNFTSIDVSAGAPTYGVDDELKRLAGLKNVYLKLTTILSTRLRGASLGPLVENVVEDFGADRIMWGSDIGQSREGYAKMVEIARDAVILLAESDFRKVLFETANALYGRKA